MNKTNTLSNLFEGKEIRSVWDSNKEDYYFSVIDVISVLTDAKIPRKYWNDLKRKLIDEGSELSEKIGQLKMISKDGKNRLTDTLDTKGILRLIESIPSPKAEPFKLWLANLGSERIDEVFDPSLAIERAIEYYRKKGYNDTWIEERIRTIINRKKLTDAWLETGIKNRCEYAILTNEIYKSWSNMTSKEYKEFKGLRKENLRDNMSDIELLLTNIGEVTTRELVKDKTPNNFKENKSIAKEGGNVAKITKEAMETTLNKIVITKDNNLNYKYDNNKKLK